MDNCEFCFGDRCCVYEAVASMRMPNGELKWFCLTHWAKLSTIPNRCINPVPSTKDLEQQESEPLV